MAVNRRKTFFDSSLSNDDASVNQISAVADVSEAEHICIHFKVDGSPNGIVYLDIANGLDTGSNGLPATWEEFDSSLFSVAGTQMWLDKDIPYTHCRLRWEPSAGSGTLSAVLTSKGDR